MLENKDGKEIVDMKHDYITYTLPNGMSIQLFYLYKEELDALIKIPTSVGQAKRIFIRNRSLLGFLLKGRVSRTQYGCPHCDRFCNHCAWTLLPSRNKSYGEPCCDVKFSGVNAHDVSDIIGYGADFEECFPYGKDDLGDNEKEATETAVSFLRAHLEWAEAIIANGGVAWTNGKITAVRQKEL